MVIEVLESWGRVFQAIDKMRGDRIDAFRLYFVSSITGRETSRLFAVKDATDFHLLEEHLVRCRPEYGSFQRFELGPGSDEIIEEMVGGHRGVLLRVLHIHAS